MAPTKQDTPGAPTYLVCAWFLAMFDWLLVKILIDNIRLNSPAFGLTVLWVMIAAVGAIGVFYAVLAITSAARRPSQ